MEQEENKETQAYFLSLGLATSTAPLLANLGKTCLKEKKFRKKEGR
jgi:hypothetical protein